MSASIRNCWLVLLCLSNPIPASAQSVGDALAGSRIGAGYAQILSLATTPDISTATYDVQGETVPLAIQVTRAVHEERWSALSERADLYWRVGGGYSRLKADFPVNVPGAGAGSIVSRWSVYSASVGLLAKVRLDDEFTLLPALDIGGAQLQSEADYTGAAARLQPVLRGALFDWTANAFLVTPGLGLDWRRAHGARVTVVRGHVAWSRITSFGAAEPSQRFSEVSGVCSIRAEHLGPTEMRVFDRQIGWVVFGGYSSFLGGNRAALGFSSVAELGAALELPITPGDAVGRRVRLGASYLSGPDVTGWSVSVGMQY
jgi:hypothetical protein